MAQIESRPHSPGEAILLAGSGRGGTTWLFNIIAANRNVRTVFEPFDPRRVPEAECLPMHPYARPEGIYPEWEAYVAAVFRGQINNDWTKREKRTWWPGRVFVKAIRANLLLGWIDDTFQPSIVWMTRHPCAVVASRVRLKWEAHIDDLLAQPELVNDFLRPYLPIIRAAKTPIQQHAVAWSIETLVPQSQMPTRNWIHCAYEDLVQQPEEESKRILTHLGIRFTPLTRRAIGRVTATTREDSALLTGHDPLTAWQSELSAPEIDTILSIVHDFGLDLYDRQPWPATAETTTGKAGISF